jgi:virginiamycin B lyase
MLAPQQSGTLGGSFMRPGRRLAVAFGALALLCVAGCGGAHRGGPGPAGGPPSISPPPVNDLRATARAIRLDGRWLAAGAGAVWLSDARAVYRLDGATGRRIATVHVPAGPCEESAVGLGAVWTATCRTPGLARIDPATNRQTGHVALAVPKYLGGEASIGVGANAVWVVVDGPGCNACRLARVDPRSLRVTALIRVMAGAAGVRVDGRSVWVTNPDSDVVQQVDAGRLRVVRTRATGDMPRFLTTDRGGALWTLNQADGTITRLDPRSGRSATHDIDIHGVGGALAAHGRWIWARGSERLLARVDERNGQVVERYGPAVGDGAVVVGFGAVWVSAPGVRTLWRLPLDRVPREVPAT